MCLIRGSLKRKEKQLTEINKKSVKIGHLFWFGHLHYTNFPGEVRVCLHMEATWWHERSLSCIGLSRSWVTVQWNDHHNHINFLMIWDHLCSVVLQRTPDHASTVISTPTNGSSGSIAGLWRAGQQPFMDHDIYTRGKNHHISTVFLMRNSVCRQLRLWYLLVVVYDDWKRWWVPTLLSLSWSYPFIPLKLSCHGHAV